MFVRGNTVKLLRSALCPNATRWDAAAPSETD